MIRILTALSLLLATEAHGTNFAIPNSEAYYCEWTHSTMKTNGFIIADGDNVAGQSLAIVTGDYAYLCSGNSKCTRFEYVKTNDIGILTYTDNDGMYMITSVMMLEIAGKMSTAQPSIKTTIDFSGSCSVYDRKEMEKRMLGELGR